MGSDILLLVSDCDEDAVALQAAAEDACSLLVAADAAQCLLLMSQSPSIILVSDRVNDVAAVCAEIQKDHPAGASTPIVLLADNDAFPDTDTDGVIRRPIDSAVLVAWLQASQLLAQTRQNTACGIVDKQDCEQLLRSFARLSHAVNNPLQALYATVDMLLLNHELTQEAAALTSEIITHASRVAKLVAEASGKAKQALKSVAPERPTQVS
jgi:hypothetical protein